MTRRHAVRRRMVLAVLGCLLVLNLGGAAPAGAYVCYKAHVLGIGQTNKTCVLTPPSSWGQLGHESGWDSFPSWRVGVWVAIPPFVAPPRDENPEG